MERGDAGDEDLRFGVSLDGTEAKPRRAEADGTLSSYNSDAKNDIGHKGQSNDPYSTIWRQCVSSSSLSRLSWIVSNFATPTSRGACCMEIEKPHVNVRPIGQIGLRGMLAESPIISQPNSVDELLVCTK